MTMTPDDVIPKVFELSRITNLSFPEKGAKLQLEISALSKEDIINHLYFAGVISEKFDHDSTEEKLFAKYCDCLLARALQELGFAARTIEERADAADVIANAENYTLVGDAKAFRLSRTAKNQKDFKVEPLNQWRKGADFAVLLAPIYQYPNSTSQIYSQAINYNVTLLSYTHLAFLLQSDVSPNDLKLLFELSGTLKGGKDAKSYWDAITDLMLKITGRQIAEWNEAIEHSLTCMTIQARKEITFWNEEKTRIKGLNHEDATNLLIDVLKIDSKIKTIKDASNLQSYLKP
jgi:hypothetical protein